MASNRILDMRIARRNVVLSVLGLAAAHALGLKGALAAGLPGHEPGQAAVDRLARQLAALVPHPQSARRIGEAYLAATPEEADAGRLIALLLPAPQTGALQTGASQTGGGSERLPPRAQLCRQLAARRDCDFRDGGTVRLNGWIVPRTEARLCALVALHGPAGGLA
jgi:hypothetical protein